MLTCGLRQLYGFASSNHALYALTGSFYNPGPYSGYLAMGVPLAVHCLCSGRKGGKAGRLFCGLVLLLLLCVLPAGMSRSAWLAAGTCIYIGIRKKRYGVCGALLALAVFSFASYPLQLPVFRVTALLLVAACLLGSSWRTWAGVALVAGITGSYRLKEDRMRVEACREWVNARIWYNTGAYEAVEKEYVRLYPLLKGRAAHRLPGRIYPYYLLAKLYAEPAYRHPEKLAEMKRLVLEKEPKVHSTAVRQMREEIRRLEAEEPLFADEKTLAK